MNVYKGPECKHTKQEIFQDITIRSTQIISHLIQNISWYVIQKAHK